jgi:hypothetical protein
MIDDPIVEEVRRARDELARKFNYDIHAIFADLRQRGHAIDPKHPLVEQAGDEAKSKADVMALHDKSRQT